MNKKGDNSTPIRPEIMGLKVGDAVQFAIERLRSVRTLASEIGLAYSRKFTTKTDRESRVIEVTRGS